MIVRGLHAGEGTGDLVHGGRLALLADGRNTATTARFRTARGATPTAEVTIGRRGKGQFTVLLEVRGGTVDVPGACPRPERTTAIQTEDGTTPACRWP